MSCSVTRAPGDASYEEREALKSDVINSLATTCPCPRLRIWQESEFHACHLDDGPDRGRTV